MATHAQGLKGKRGGSGTLVEFLDRWFYVGMALFLIAVILIGFVPDSFLRAGDIAAGGRPWFLWQAHFHALTMAAWMGLLLTQTVLIATGRNRWHMQLGLFGMVLAPLMVIGGVMLVPAQFAARIAFAEAGDPAEVADMARAMTNTALLQLRSGISFALLVAIALAARRFDAGMHKRMMILATISPIGAAFARMPFLYNSQPQSPLSTLAWPAVCVIPMIAWDLYRQRLVHPAYWIFLAGSLVVMWLWDTPGWQALAGPLLHP